MRQVNTRFFFILLAAAAIFAVALFGVHRLQAGNIRAALLWQASQAEKNGKPELAARYLGRYLEFAPDDIDERAHLATVLADEKIAVTPAAARRAEFSINQVLARDPQRHDLRQALCRIALAGRKLDLAREHLDYLQAKLPDSGDVAFLVGQWQELQLQSRGSALDPREQEKLTQLARTQYELAIEAAPQKVEAYLRLVALLKQLDFGKEPRHAAEIDRRVAQALEHAPDDAAVLSLAAQRAQEKGDFAAALKYLESGLKQNPTEPRLYQALARLHSQQGNRGEAIAQLNKGLQAVARQHQFELRWTLANVLLDDEQMEAARKNITLVRDVNPMSADYLEARCLMQQARWYDAAQTFEKLRPAFKSVAELSLQLDLFLGLCYEKLDERLLQLAVYQRAAKTDPSSLVARHGEARALWALGRPEEALGRFRTLIERNTSPAEAARWRLDYARMLLQRGSERDPQMALKVRRELEEAEKELRNSVEASILRAELLFAEKQPEQAEAELRKAVQAHPKRFEPWISLASLAMAAKHPEKAEELLTEAATKAGDTADSRLAQVRFWARHRKDPSTALAGLEKGLSRFTAGEQARLYETLAEAYYHAGHPAESARLLRQLAALPEHLEDIRVRMQMLSLALTQDDEPEMQRVLAEVRKIEAEGGPEWSYGEALRLTWRARRGEPAAIEQARSLLKAAAARRPDWPAVFLAHGELDELQGKPQQAITSYRKAIDLGSRDADGLYQLVLLLCKAQRFEEAEQTIRKMAQVEVDPAAGKRVVALLASNMELQGAAHFARKLVRPQSKDYRDHLWLGQVLSAGGRESPDAEAAFRQAVALGEGQPETWVALVRYLATTGQFAKAIAEIESAEKKLAGDIKLPTVARCYDALGALDRAEAAYKEALEKQPQSSAIHRAAAEFLLRVGKPQAAERLYRKLLEGGLGTTDDDLAIARRGLALALARSGDPKRLAEALQMVGLALDSAGKLDQATLAESPEGRLAQARVLATLASHALRARAIELLETLDQKHGLQAEDQYLLARLLHPHSPDQATWQKAQAILRALTASHPNHARFLADHANLLLLHKEVPRAEPLIARLEQLEQERKLPPGALGSIELKARALELRGKELQAIALLQGFAQQKDAPAGRSLLLASLHGRLGNYQEGVDLCYQVKAKGYREEAYGAAIGLLRAGKPAAGQAAKLQRWHQQAARIEESLRHAIDAETGNIMLRLQLADLMELLGRSDGVESLCRSILALDANNLVALNNLAWLLAGQVGKEQEALGLIQRAIQQHGGRPELLDTRAVVHLSLGNAAQAVKDLEAVVRAAPTPSRYFHLTRAHLLAKNAPQALAALQRANDLGLDVQRLHPNDQAVYPRVVDELQQR
jgi:tetratricopeptide (TPR) repeat protein